MKKKIQKKRFVFEIITAEFVALSCLYQEENTCHRHSVSWETVVRFCTSLTENFYKTIDFPVINKYGKEAFFKVEQCLGTFTMLLLVGSSETGHFRH